jgi:hypothetical protein
MKRAITLAEVVLALGLMVLVVLTVMALFGKGLRLSSKNRDAVAATQLANSLHERLVGGTITLPGGATSFDGSIPQAAVSGFPPAPYPAQTVDATDYTLKVTTAPVATVANLVQVSVEVSWHGNHKVRVDSYHYRP